MSTPGKTFDQRAALTASPPFLAGYLCVIAGLMLGSAPLLHLTYEPAAQLPFTFSPGRLTRGRFSVPAHGSYEIRLSLQRTVDEPEFERRRSRLPAVDLTLT